ncbi:MAG: hypothetical protein AMXMBFR84_02710 [Candidatus Hydrogenedentota bacterium]
MAALVLAAFAYRIAYWLLLGRVIDTADAIHYLNAAQTFAEGGFLSADPRIPPLYPLLTACLGGLLQVHLETAACLISLAAGSLALVPICGIARKLHGPSSARVMALLFILWPWLVDCAARVSPDALAILLWFSGLLAFAKAVRGEGSFWKPAVLYFLLHLTRPEGVLIAVASCAASVALIDRETRTTLGARPLRWASGLLLFATMFAGYLLWMRAATGEFVLSPRIGQPAEALQYALVDRGKDTAKAFLQLFSHTLPVMLGPYLLCLAGFGLLHTHPAIRRDFRLECFLLLMASAQFVVAGLSTHAEPRYLMATTVALSIFACRGMIIAGDAWGHKHHLLRRAPVWVLALLLVAGMAAVAAPRWMGRMSYQPIEYKIAGEWMKAHLEPGLVFTRKPQVGYYAGMPTTGPAQTDTLDQAIDRAQAAGARYFVVDERYSTQMVPSLKPLLDPAHAPPELKLVEAGLSPLAEARIVIYEIVAP